MTTSQVARRYFDAVAARDIDAMAACWHPGGIDRLVGQQDLVAPDGVREYFTEMFGAFPDLTFEVLNVTASGRRAAVRWRARGTFAGPGTFQGFDPNGATVDVEGCDVVVVEGDLVQHNDAYFDGSDFARQLGFLPSAGSAAEGRLTKLANLRTRIATRIHGAKVESVADGVWVVRGGFPARIMNVYLLEDDGGVTVFDGGIKDMTGAVAAAGARLGGIKRVVLGHVDADHRGVAPSLGAPVYCHPRERDAAASDSPFRDYWDLSKLTPPSRFVNRTMLPRWDGGRVAIEGTVEEGDSVAGFKVIDLPGHAPGLIGLFRGSDRLALVTDCVYTFDVNTGIAGRPRTPHAAFTLDAEEARASIRKLAALKPSAAWAGHTKPVTGDVVGQLERAAAA